ncbi:hypothetical protein PI125_g17839 [Phytophthora idaei]|nr:hypothetical protein PI125_g17839 [Phytophthora idaei]
MAVINFLVSAMSTNDMALSGMVETLLDQVLLQCSFEGKMFDLQLFHNDEGLCQRVVYSGVGYASSSIRVLMQSEDDFAGDTALSPDGMMM